MNINNLLAIQVNKIKPDKEDLKNIERTAYNYCEDIKRALKKRKVKADVFIGGSLAKRTLIKKESYDIDIFVRFDERYRKQDMPRLLGLSLGKKYKKIHGSRDYYQTQSGKIIVEVIPVLKIKKPQESQNVTDLSFFHVNYILKNIETDKSMADEIILAKTFAYAQNCYGAEGYIQGFSGYSLELLISHYKTFLNFIRAVAKSNINEKIIIDDSKFYEDKKDTLNKLNKSKINSQIILVDPTFKERNALAGLGRETFLRFRKICIDFLKKPSNKFFEKRKISEELKKKYKNKLRVISIKTNMQKGDIAGTKSRKFSNFLNYNIRKEFDIKKQEFEYNEKNNTAYAYFVLEKKDREIIKGPHITKTGNLTEFREKHKNAFIKNHFAYARIKHDLSFNRFFEEFKRKNKKIIREMCIKEIKNC